MGGSETDLGVSVGEVRQIGWDKENGISPSLPLLTEMRCPLSMNSIHFRIISSPLYPFLGSSVISEEVLNPLKIDCITSSPKSGENVTLRCLVHGKRVDGAYVSWYKGLFPVDERIENVSCNDGSGFISYVTFKTEEEEQKCEIRCEVSVDAEQWEEIYILELGKSHITRS